MKTKFLALLIAIMMTSGAMADQWVSYVLYPQMVLLPPPPPAPVVIHMVPVPVNIWVPVPVVVQPPANVWIINNRWCDRPWIPTRY